jgi:NAD(P)-dependent dehydrogenase (short-subunit alcohol dehydrogenase family)
LLDMVARTARIALVTGANRGIGAGIAHLLAASGHVVAVASRVLEDGEVVAESIAQSTDGDAFAVQLDVTDPTSVRSAVSTVVARAGGLHVLVNNAGGHYDTGAAASSVGDHAALAALEVNLLGPWRLIRESVPHMRASGWGRIVNVSSRSGSFEHTWSDAPAYGVSKAALNMLTVQLANELDGSGILVNACCPGWVRTRMGGPDAERSTDEGADTPFWLATLDDDGPSGGFFGDRSIIAW